ncbi:MAG: hypothetical protein R2744_13985 [Bacteroidales bacterium]
MLILPGASMVTAKIIYNYEVISLKRAILMRDYIYLNVSYSPE